MSHTLGRELALPAGEISSARVSVIDTRLVHLLDTFVPYFIGSICDKNPGSTKITTRLRYISRCETTSGTNWFNRWTYRISIINTRRDEIRVGCERTADNFTPLIRNPNQLFPSHLWCDKWTALQGYLAHRKNAPLGPNSTTIPRALWWS